MSGLTNLMGYKVGFDNGTKSERDRVIAWIKWELEGWKDHLENNPVAISLNGLLSEIESGDDPPSGAAA